MSFDIDWKFTIKLIFFHGVVMGYIFFYLRKGKVYRKYMTIEIEGKDLRVEADIYTKYQDLNTVATARCGKMLDESKCLSNLVSCFRIVPA
jgi:hypothetical protein